MTQLLQNLSFRVAIAVAALALVPQIIFAFDAGNTAVTRSVVDTYANFTIVDTNNPFASAGDVIEFEYYAENTNPFRILVVDETNQVEWVSDEITPTADAVGTYEPSPVVPVLAGWNLAVYSASTGVIPFDWGGVPAAYETNNAGLPEVGDILSIVGTSDREYSLNATLDADTDGDGVMDSEDLCAGGLSSDAFPQFGKAKGRYMWNGTAWVTAGKGDKNFKPDMDYTYGCTGKQILDRMSDKLDADLGGHYKHGLSKSILEAWHAGEYYVGKTLIDTVTVDSAVAAGANSTAALDVENDYFIAVSGTWTNRGVELVDAEYSNYNGLGWVNGPDGGYPADLLDLQVNKTFVNWGALSGTNSYEIPYSPATDGVANFRVFDHFDLNAEPDGSWYGDNVGSLTVKVFEDLWVDLW